MNRIYIISYKFYETAGGGFKYAANPRFELRTEFFRKNERDAFIKKYLDLSSSDKTLYIDDVKCYTAIPEEIKDMNPVINAI